MDDTDLTRHTFKHTQDALEELLSAAIRMDECIGNSALYGAEASGLGQATTEWETANRVYRFAMLEYRLSTSPPDDE